MILRAFCRPYFEDKLHRLGLPIQPGRPTRKTLPFASGFRIIHADQITFKRDRGNTQDAEAKSMGRESKPQEYYLYFKDF